MTEKEAARIFEQAAAAKGIPVEEVRAKIQRVIALGINSKDPETQEQWREMSKKGEWPTPEEVIMYLSQFCEDDSSPE